MFIIIPTSICSRISPKQIKLDKVKAQLDSNIPLTAGLIADSDAHLFSSLLKCYLRELPVPFLGSKDPMVYKKWLDASRLPTNERTQEIRNIIQLLPKEIVLNIQYLVKFLSELSTKSKETKMTPHNIAICLGPTLLWNDRTSLNEQGNVEHIIAVVAALIEAYNEIFPIDFPWKEHEDAELKTLLEEGRELHHGAVDQSFQYRHRSNTSVMSEKNTQASNGTSLTGTLNRISSVGISRSPSAGRSFKNKFWPQ